jgi:hypothetical protein
MRGLLLATVLLAAVVPQAKAQNLFDLLEVGCSELGQAAGYEWLCRAGALARQVEETLRAFREDFIGFGRDLLDGWLEDALSAVAQGVGLSELEDVFGALDVALAAGPVALREAVSRALADLRRSNHAARQDVGTLIVGLRSGEVRDDGHLYDLAVQANPNAAAAEGILNARQDRLVETRAEAAAVHEMNTRLAEQVATETAMQDAVAQVLAPSIGGMGGGDAARLDDAARTAVSSRAAIQVLTEGLADLMRHQATFSGYLSDSLRVLAQQQVMTTWELHLAIQALTEQMNQDVIRRKAEIEAHLAQEYDAGLELAEALRSVAGGASSTLLPNLDVLAFETLGW